MDKILNKVKEFTKKEIFKDIVLVGILVIIYSFISFKNLGSTINPQTFCDLSAGQSVTLELKEETDISKIRYFMGHREGRFKIFGSIDGDYYSEIGDIDSKFVLSWNDLITNMKVKYISINTLKSTDIGEIQIYDRFSKKVKLIGLSDEANKLVDEPKVVPETISYENSAYFDEVYFARSAYQHANDLPAAEYTHPHLGKIIQSIPLFFFGCTPFSYRLMGNIAGILMRVIMYIFGKKVFKKRRYAFLASFLMAFDNFHFVQTRIGTVDSFLILFCLTSTFFMYQYFTLPKTAKLKQKLIYLFFSGLFFGMAVSVKWIAMYTGLGLAILFFGKMIYESIKDKKFDKQNIPIMAACIVFYIIIPLIIYISCFYTYETVQGKVNSLQDIWKYTCDMFNFHSTLTATHPFSSEWYTWPIMLKPIWYNVTTISETQYSTIAAIGNPAIWWPGIAALVFVLLHSLIKRDKESIFIIVMFLSVWLPYAFIGRIMFIYHYFMALPFVMLSIVSLMKAINSKFDKWYIMAIYMAIVLVMFFIFYPVVSGVFVPKSYINSLHWFSTWTF